MGVFFKYLKHLWLEAYECNTRNIVNCLETNPSAVTIDLGCDEGHLTKRFNENIQSFQFYGSDFSEESLKVASSQGIKTIKMDFNSPFPLTLEFDAVITNQVIEHLYETDQFVEWIYSILKPGGYLVISTENLSSWHNVFALAIGLPAFSQHISSKKIIGNPLSLISGAIARQGFTHVKIFNVKGLIALLELYGFKIERIMGAGYYPLPSILERFMSWINPSHSAFITIKARKSIG